MRRGSDSLVIREQDDAVEGVILMRTGEKTQNVLKQVEAERTIELNKRFYPRTSRLIPFYDRSELIALTTRTVEDNLLRGMALVVSWSSKRPDLDHAGHIAQKLNHTADASRVLHAFHPIQSFI